MHVPNSVSPHPIIISQSKIASSYSPPLYTDVQPLKIPNVPHDVPSKPSTSTVNPPINSRCTSANQAQLPSVSLLNKSFSIECTSKVSPILLSARSLLSKISTLRRFLQCQPYDITRVTETCLTGYTLKPNIFQWLQFSPHAPN